LEKLWRRDYILTTDDSAQNSNDETGTLDLSIVIPTYGRSEKVNNLLRSLIASDIAAEFEVLIIEDGPQQNQIDEAVLNKLGPRIRRFWSQERRFISEAKNLGIRQSAGRYILFVDDDNVFTDSTVACMLEEISSSSGIGCLMPVIYYNEERERVWVYSAPFRKNRWSFNLVGRNQKENEPPEWKYSNTDALPDCFIVKRSLAIEVGGFDASLQVNSSADFCQKVKNKGYLAVSCSNCRIYHDVSYNYKPGYWAEHAVSDERRTFIEARDWALFHVRLHQDEPLVRIQALVRSSYFMAAVFIGSLLIAYSRPLVPLRILRNMLLGLFSGLKSVP